MRSNFIQVSEKQEPLHHIAKRSDCSSEYMNRSTFRCQRKRAIRATSFVYFSAMENNSLCGTSAVTEIWDYNHGGWEILAQKEAAAESLPETKFIANMDL